MRRRTFLQAALTAFASAPGVGASQAATKPARVLFIGNSLTYANNLPAMIDALVTESGGEMTSRTIAFPDFGLEEHWNDGRAMRALREGTWTLVVLQQGPSSLPESRVVLRDYTNRFARVAKDRGAQVALFSVWPPFDFAQGKPRPRAFAFDAVTESYRLAAQDVGGTVVPAGEAMRAALGRDPALPLFDADGFHPSPVGSYLAALVFFQRITGQSPATTLPPSQSSRGALRALRITAPQVKILQDAAADATAAPGKND
jgi:hypothetical protein